MVTIRTLFPNFQLIFQYTQLKNKDDLIKTVNNWPDLFAFGTLSVAPHYSCFLTSILTTSMCMYCEVTSQL